MNEANHTSYRTHVDSASALVSFLGDPAPACFSYSTPSASSFFADTCNHDLPETLTYTTFCPPSLKKQQTFRPGYPPSPLKAPMLIVSGIDVFSWHIEGFPSLCTSGILPSVSERLLDHWTFEYSPKTILPSGTPSGLVRMVQAESKTETVPSSPTHASRTSPWQGLRTSNHLVTLKALWPVGGGRLRAVRVCVI